MVIVRESEIDVAALATLRESARQSAIAHLAVARGLLAPLREGFSEGTSPEILRAIGMAINAIEESLEE